MPKYKIFLGYDPREDLTYKLAEYSILSRTSSDVEIVPLVREKIKCLKRPVEWRINENGVKQLWCPISDAPMSTEFAISRFSIPLIEKGETGWRLFADSDIICLTDIKKLFDLAEQRSAVMVVKHKHEPTEKYHDAGQLQSFYRRKNWSSVILWNLDHPSNQRLTEEELNTRPGRDLHAFHWLNEYEIGELPESWNYLVGVNEPADLRKQNILHYTNGQPGWPGWIPQETDYLFNEELEKYKKTHASRNTSIIDS